MSNKLFGIERRAKQKCLVQFLKHLDNPFGYVIMSLGKHSHGLPNPHRILKLIWTTISLLNTEAMSSLNIFQEQVCCYSCCCYLKKIQNF